MSYASVEDQKGRYALDEARIRAGSAENVAGIQADTQKYGADRGLEGTSLTAAAHEYGADKASEASKYGSDQTFWGAVAPKESYQYFGTKAKGGLVAARRPYLVGEKGPELMVPETNGRIIPNHKLQMLAGRPVPRAEGGPVRIGGAAGGGGGDRSAVVANLRAAARKEWADTPVSAHGEYFRAMAQPLNRAENDAVAAANGSAFKDYWLQIHGVAAPPKFGEPGFADYHGALTVAQKFGPEAARQIFAERQAVRKYVSSLPASSLPKDFSIDNFINAAAANPAVWTPWVQKSKPATPAPGTLPAAPAGTATVPATPSPSPSVDLGAGLAPSGGKSDWSWIKPTPAPADEFSKGVAFGPTGPYGKTPEEKAADQSALEAKRANEETYRLQEGMF